MELQKLAGFIKFAEASANPFVRQQATTASKDLREYGEEEQEQTPELKGNAPHAEKTKDEIDVFLSKALPEMDEPDKNDTSFGKAASAYVRDVRIEQLAKEVQAEIKRFIPNSKATVVFYGMVTDELLPKVDPKNFASATAHTRKEHRGEDKEKLKDAFLERAKKKFILMMNDRVVDGHHFLAKAKELGITNSLNVLDLTPARVVEKKSAFKKLAARVK